LTRGVNSLFSQTFTTDIRIPALDYVVTATEEYLLLHYSKTIITYLNNHFAIQMNG